jgi:hypothetical protein
LPTAPISIEVTNVNYLPEVVKVEHVDGFVLATWFNDGTEKLLDISQWFRGPVFRSLKNPRVFRKFFIEGGTLAWPNGVDVAPEALYQAADIRRLHK